MQNQKVKKEMKDNERREISNNKTQYKRYICISKQLGVVDKKKNHSNPQVIIVNTKNQD